MRETYAKVYQLRAEAQRMTEQAEQLAIPWRNGPHSEQWAHLAEAVHDWSTIPDRMRRWTDRLHIDGMPDVSGDVERRNIYQAQILTEPQVSGVPAIAPADQQRAVDSVDEILRTPAAYPDGASVSALIRTAHYAFGNPGPSHPSAVTDRHVDLDSNRTADFDLDL